MGKSFLEQLEDQRTESEGLRSAFVKLQQKLTETRAHCELLIAEHRRARAIGKSQQAQSTARSGDKAASIERYKSQLRVQQAANHANLEFATGESLEERFVMLEREQQVEALLAELKNTKALSA